MGCDIHSIAEINTTGYDDEGEPTAKRWRAITEGLFDSPYFYADKPISLSNLPMNSTPLSNRNYRLFGILADVRNGRGFAGTDIGDRLTPIAEPRGVPFDASPEWRRYVERWGADLHSTSYFTVAELLAYDWDQISFDRGYVDEATYLQLRGTEQAPGSYSGGIWGGNIITMSALEYESLAPGVLASLHGEGKDIRVQHQWARTYRSYADELFVAIERLTASAPRDWNAATRSHGEPHLDDVRICFGFDN